MSKYGGLWEQVRWVREDLKSLMPGAKVDSLEAANLEFEAFVKEQENKVKRIKRLFSKWQSLENKMKDAE